MLERCNNDVFMIGMCNRLHEWFAAKESASCPDAFRQDANSLVPNGRSAVFKTIVRPKYFGHALPGGSVTQAVV